MEAGITNTTPSNRTYNGHFTCIFSNPRNASVLL
jgi:hypothetical protein